MRGARWLGFALVASALPAVGQTLVSAGVTLSFPAANDGGYRLVVHPANGADVTSDEPVAVLVCGPCANEAAEQVPVTAAYKTVKKVGDAVVAEAEAHTAAGSRFGVEDRYTVGKQPGTFTLARTVTVLARGGADAGFNSQFVAGFARPLGIEQYHFLAPGIWYDKNKGVAADAIASQVNDPYIYWRETRSPLPFVMMQDPATGTALSVAHIDGDPHSGADERAARWIVDGSVQYGALGVQHDPTVKVGFIYPADEGQRTYVGGKNAGWVRRSHPVTVGFVQKYTLAIGVSVYADYDAALAGTWREYFDLMHPPIANVPASAVHAAGIGLLNHYFVRAGGGAGFPFSVDIPGGAVRAVSFQMGFVGQQIPLGFQLLREGVLHGDKTSLENGKAVLDFWATKAAQPSGLPLTWYNPDQNRWRNTGCQAPIFTRTVSDGMEGMTNAAVLMRQHGMAQPAWERFAQGYGDWLVKNQAQDGSWGRAYAPDGTVFTNREGCSKNGFGESKYNTSNPVRFLVSLYFATGDRKYLTAAVKAGEFVLRTTVEPFVYVGGIIDNPNVIDKLAGVLALRAMLALYDATHEAKWLDAARKAADMSETWNYGWTFPVKNAPVAYRAAGAQASSLIATGQSGVDIELGVESYDFYRLHLLGDDASQHYLQEALYLESNTKLTTQLPGVPGQQFGFAVDGLVGEAYSVASMDYVPGVRGPSVQWLPWLTDIELEPGQRQEDTFGSMAIRDAEKLPVAVRMEKNSKVYPAAGSLGWGK